jgi:hypothetical protein
MKNQINQFIQNHPIYTGGAITKYKISIKKIDDGDVYYRLTIPFWSHNNYVVYSVFDFINALRKNKTFSSKTIYLKEDKFIVNIYERICDAC